MAQYKKIGKCTNYTSSDHKGCSLADGNKEIEVDLIDDFVCPECHSELMEVVPSGSGKRWIWGVVAAVVVGGGAAGGYFALRDTNVYVSNIRLDKAAYTVVAGEQATIAATVEPADATDGTLVWSSSDNEVLIVADGKVTALKPGKAVVSVKSNDSKAAAEAEVTVEEPVVEEPAEEVDTTVYVSAVKTEQEKYTVTVGKEETIVATVEPEDAADKTLAWSSSDESVLTVADGVVKGVKAGKATVAIKSNDGKAETEVEVEVVKPAATAPAFTNIAFSGKLKNGYPHGTGTMTFKKERRIDAHDQKNRTAKAGDYLIGEWDQGHLVQARWYDSANNLKETIVLGKAMNPELDRSLYK